MLDFQNKRLFERIFYSKLAIGALAIFLLFILNALWGVYDKYLEAARNKDRAVAEYSAMETQADALRDNLALLSTERGIEKKIREEFGFVKEGEGVVVIMEEDNVLDTPSAQQKNFFRRALESMRSLF